MFGGGKAFPRGLAKGFERLGVVHVTRLPWVMARQAMDLAASSGSQVHVPWQAYVLE